MCGHTKYENMFKCWRCRRVIQPGTGIQSPINDQGYTATFCGLKDCESFTVRNNGVQYDISGQ